MKKSSFLFSLIVLVLLGLFSSCEKENILPKNPDSDSDGVTNPAPLNFFEDDMVGKWSRYHSYDGSYMYYIFHSDRTACYWEEVSSSRKDKANYAHWELVDEGNNIFSIKVKGSSSGSLYSIGKFKYAPDVILKGGYSNLQMTRSSTSRECE